MHFTGAPTLTTSKQEGSSRALQSLESLSMHPTALTIPRIFKTRHMDYCTQNNSYLHTESFVFLSLLLSIGKLISFLFIT